MVKVLYFNAWKLFKGFMRLHVVNKRPGTSMFNRNNFQEGVKGIDLFICPPTMWCHFVVAHQLCGTCDAVRIVNTFRSHRSCPPRPRDKSRVFLVSSPTTGLFCGRNESNESNTTSAGSWGRQSALPNQQHSTSRSKGCIA